MSQYEDRKSGVQDDTDPPPPSYIKATSSGIQSDSIVPKGNPLHESLKQLLRRLPAQLRTARQDQFGQQQDDEYLLAERCTPYIAEFLHKLPTSVLYPRDHQQPLLAQLILSPANSVPATQGWGLSDLGQRKESAVHVQVVEVDLFENKKLEKPDGKLLGTFNKEIGEDRNDLVWWRKEGLAHRLASRIRTYLEPESKTDSKTRTSANIEANSGLQQKANEGNTRHEAYAHQHKSPASLFSGHGKKSHATTSPRGLGSHSQGGALPGTANDETERVKVSVQTEEVTFRRENDMGLWESSSGWAIILIVAVTP